MRVIGWRRSSGNYDGFNFDNAKVFCIGDSVDAKYGVGETVEILKLPYTQFISLNIELNDSVNPVYNRYGKVDSLIKL